MTHVALVSTAFEQAFGWINTRLARSNLVTGFIPRPVTLKRKYSFYSTVQLFPFRAPLPIMPFYGTAFHMDWKGLAVSQVSKRPRVYLSMCVILWIVAV